MRIAGVGEGPGEFQIGVEPGHHAPEHLQNREVVEDDAGVALFRVADPRIREFQIVGALAYESHAVPSRVGAHEFQDRLARRLVVERVGSGAAVDVADDADADVLLGNGAIPSHEDLIALGDTIVERDIENNVIEVVVNSGDNPIDVVHGTVLTRVPTLPGQPLGPRRIHQSSSGSRNCSQ